MSAGRPLGKRREPWADVDGEPPPESPSKVLEELIIGALSTPPCVVAFSGGRDSSAMLAAATGIAREHGFEDPVVYTMRFPAAPRTAEDEWQELVVRHLGLDGWHKREVNDELDSMGPLALDVLRRFGVHWPSNAHTFKLTLESAEGGSLLTGSGGDELFLPWSGRGIARIRRGRALPRRHDLRPLIRYLMPNSLLGRRPGYSLRWLTPEAGREVGRSVAAEQTRVERNWVEAIDEYLDSRYLEVTLRLASAMAHDQDVNLVEPFFDRRYIRAVSADAPPDGYDSRATPMKRYFGDLLPAEVPTRSGKAVFTEVFCGPETRSFAERWTGEGVDPALVDLDALRAEWLAERPDFRSLVPMQAARLASER